jgi:hypothetical protein
MMGTICTSVFLAGCATHGKEPVETFTNPLLPAGADPWVVYEDGYFYYIKSQGRSLVLMKTPDITALAQAETKVIWKATEGTDHSKNLWAPEIQYMRGGEQLFIPLGPLHFSIFSTDFAGHAPVPLL